MAFGIFAMAVAAPTPPATPVDPAKVEPGLIGLAFFLGTVIALVLLGRSIIRQMKRLDRARQPGGWAAREPEPMPSAVRPDGSGEETAPESGTNVLARGLDVGAD